jgi:type IV pilus assembly protein PilE
MKPIESPYVRGFALLELFVALAVLAIVIALALPSYRQYVRRANRSEAATALLRIAAAQERFYLQNGRFAGSEELAAAPPTGLGIGEHALYVLDIAPDTDLALGYVARATVRAESAQRDDSGCWVLSIDERGVRGAATSAGVSDKTVAARCWR